MTNYGFQSKGPFFIITGPTSYNIVRDDITIIDLDSLTNDQLILIKTGLEYNELISVDSVAILGYIDNNATIPGTTSDEQIQDAVGFAIVGQNGADVTYDDNANQIIVEVPDLVNKVDSIPGYGLSENNFDDFLASHSYDTIQAFHDVMSGAAATGANLSLTGGINFSVSAGRGYAKDLDGNSVVVEWTTPLTDSVEQDGDNFIYVDYLGNIIQQNTRDNSDAIYVGYIRTGFGNTQIVGWSPVKFIVKDYYFHLSQFITTGIGTIIEDGCNISLQAFPDNLKVTLGAGRLWIDLTDKDIADTSTFTKLFNSSDYGFIPDTATTANTINNAYINNPANGHLTALVPMTPGYYKKDLFFITPEGALYYVYATEEYATEELAIAGSIPQVPEQIKHSIARVGAVIIQEGATAVVDVYDIRPMFSKLFQTGTPSSPTTVIDHGDLAGLNDDDHLLYHTDARGDVRYNTKAQITAFLAAKADTAHTHVISDVTGLQGALDAKADTAHSHVIGDVTGLQTALNNKEDAVTATTSADYYRGDKTFAALNKTAVGLPNVDNTSDASKPISTLTQTALNAKEPTLTAGTALQYYRGDKTWQTLNAAAVGLGSVSNIDTTNAINITSGTLGNARLTSNLSQFGGLTLADGDFIQYVGTSVANRTAAQARVSLSINNVDNTSDANKPISSLTQTALNAKEPTVTAGTTAQYYRGDKTWQTLNGAAVGLGNVVNLDTSTTTNITSALDKRFVTDAQLTLINNTSGTNSGDETTATIKTKLGVATGSVDGYLTAANFTIFNAKESAITAGTTAQYWRGDKSWQTLNSAAVGLGNVSNTSDANKPVSTATQTALDLKANLASPALTGVPTAPTATAGTSTTQLATTAFTTTALANKLSINAAQGLSGAEQLIGRQNLDLTSTLNIAESTNKNLLTDVERTKLSGLRKNGTTGLWERDYNGTWVPFGQVIQTVVGNIPVTTGTATTPLDNSVPLITDGFQIFSQSFTPLLADSTIYVIFGIMLDSSSNNRTITTAVYASGTMVGSSSSNVGTSGRPLSTTITRAFASPGTSPITITARVGANSGTTTYVNRSAFATLGGSAASAYTILEIK